MGRAQAQWSLLVYVCYLYSICNILFSYLTYMRVYLYVCTAAVSEVNLPILGQIKAYLIFSYHLNCKKQNKTKTPKRTSLDEERKTRIRRTGRVLVRECRAGNPSDIVLYSASQARCVKGRGAILPITSQ